VSATWLNHGATTLWEQWSGAASHNHAMFAPVDELFYNFLAGIRPPTGDTETKRAYRKIHIKPFVPQELNEASATVFTFRGEISSSWKKFRPD